MRRLRGVLHLFRPGDHPPDAPVTVRHLSDARRPPTGNNDNGPAPARRTGRPMHVATSLYLPWVCVCERERESRVSDTMYECSFAAPV